MSWRPLWTGELAERAMVRAREIAIAQAEAPTATAADRVLYWAYTTAVFDEAFANDAYGAALDDLVASLRRGAPHLGLFGGLANGGWVLCHTLDADDSEDSLGAIDEALLRVLAVDEWRGAHDLIEGLTGFGVYFLERIDHGAGDKARDGLARVVSHLERTALWCEVGTNTGSSSLGATWHTPLSILPPHFAADYPDGFFDCGIAHGVPGMIGLLARASAYIDPARACALGARRWLEATRRNDEFPSKLAGPPSANAANASAANASNASAANANAANANAANANAANANASNAANANAANAYAALRFETARTAWCYGDPGIALGLARLAALDAHDAPDRNAHDAHAAIPRVDPYALALAALQRDLASSQVIDATLCHGSAGLGHIANRFFHATGNPAFADTARIWFAHALEQPIADDRAFLDGSAGVGLALIAACTDTEPAWDRLLLADLAYSES